MSSDGFTPIISMFYSVFHPTEGTKVVCQVPNGSIVPVDRNKDSSSMSVPLFDFDSIKNYVIPKPALCNKLVTFKISSYRVVGFPVNIYASQYARNSFSFNLCFVFKYEDDTTPYEGHVKRLGRMFRALEEQSQMLSKAEKNHEVYFKAQTEIEQKTWSKTSNYIRTIHDENVGDEITFSNQNIENSESDGLILSSIESLVQQIYQDLNNYSECLIPIDAANSVDIKLFPIFPPPPEVNAYDVPIATVKLEAMVDPLWDPTMLRILPFIDGINSVKKISILADSDYELTKQCIQHLIHFRSVAMLDIFQFSNCYAPTSQISNLLRDPTVASECLAYVISPTGTFSNLPFQTERASKHNYDTEIASTRSSILEGDKPPRFPESQPSFSPKTGSIFQNKHDSKTTFVPLPSKATLFYLYRSMNQNYTLKQWYIENNKLLTHIDIRRFITFGVLRGLIYRVRSYPISNKLSSYADVTPVYTHQKDHRRGAYKNFIPPANQLNPSSKTINEDEEEKSAQSLDEQDDKRIDSFDLDSQHMKRQQELKLSSLLKRCRDFDAICTEMNLSKSELTNLLSRIGEWNVINS
uniref:Nitrogen permease regulator n=1 Tax=Ogataea thermomethanolica (nom. inval.) TaxID=310468 RepID=A0A7R6UXV6_9ASCO|nr:nitrogen permease regulator [Ogataea thermomethanolica (nom. inval.)]